MTPDREQYYLRAEPTDEGRALLRHHQRQLARVCGDLRLNPRLTKFHDLHWTTIFLGSPERWTKAFREIGVDLAVTADDLFWLAGVKLPKIADANFGSSTRLPTPDSRLPGEASAKSELTTQPDGYDVFYNGLTSAVFVLRLDRSAERPAKETIEVVRARLLTWEQRGRLPVGTAGRLFRHRAFPLARDRDGGKPHVTLARGRVSRERQRDVLRTLRHTRLISREPIAFGKTSLRVVGDHAGRG